MKPGYVENALHMMQAYLVDCAKEKVKGSNRCTEDLNRAIRACVESLAVDRRDDCRGRDPRLPDALSYAIRYVDEYLDAKLTWDHMASELGTNAFAFGRRIKLWTGTRRDRYVNRSRLQCAMKLLRDSTMRLTTIARSA